MRPAIFILLLISFAYASEPITPGEHKHLPCKSAADFSYDLFVPKTYATDTKHRYPVLFLSSPGGNPGFMRLEEWADKTGVLLVAINDSKNGLNFKDINRIQDAVIQTVEATLRVHPCLRFSIGLSGAAWASMTMASRLPDSHAGVIAMAHSGNHTTFATHIAIVFIHGDQDKVHPCSAVEAAYEDFKRKGNPARDLLVPGRGHENATRAEIETNLTWMLNYERLTHPKLPPDEKAAAQAEVKQRMAHCADLQDPAARLEESDLLSGLPGIEKFPEYKTVLTSWFTATFDAAHAQPDPIAQHGRLVTLSEDPRARLLTSAEQTKISKELTDLGKQPDVKNEWDAYQAYERVAKAEASSGRLLARLKEAAQGYEACAKQYANTKAGKKAAEAAARLGNLK